MFDMNVLAEFLGWCLIINIGILSLSTILLILLKETISKLHSKLFGVDQNHLSEIYLVYLGNYKVAIILLNLVPYIALKIMI